MGTNLGRWLTSSKAKKHQRRMNKYMRDLNENIKNDNLWQGRFYIHQVDRQRFVYEDHSGTEFWVALEMVDRKTGYTKRIVDTVNHWTFGNSLWWEMNNFIIDDVRVWSEDPKPGSPEWFTNINWVKE